MSFYYEKVELLGSGLLKANEKPNLEKINEEACKDAVSFIGVLLAHGKSAEEIGMLSCEFEELIDKEDYYTVFDTADSLMDKFEYTMDAFETAELDEDVLKEYTRRFVAVLSYLMCELTVFLVDVTGVISKMGEAFYNVKKQQIVAFEEQGVVTAAKDFVTGKREV